MHGYMDHMLYLHLLDSHNHHLGDGSLSLCSASLCSAFESFIFKNFSEGDVVMSILQIRKLSFGGLLRRVPKKPKHLHRLKGMGRI